MPPTISTGTPAHPGTRGSRWEELDTLRFVAIFGVMCEHFSKEWLARYGAWGRWGVEFFFVLSGFLITYLLLTARQRMDRGQSTWRQEARHFYQRRILRLWPLYFVALAIAVTANLSCARSGFAYHVFFATNYYAVHLNDWPGLMSHFWTLAVENQFYLIWPWLIFCLPRSWLPALFVLLIASGPAYRRFGVHFGLTTPFATDLTIFACLDFFAWGAALAWLRHHRSNWTQGRGRVALSVAAAGAAVLLWRFHHPVPLAQYRRTDAWTGSVCAIASAALIYYCLSEGRSWLRRGLVFRPFVYLGGISYGIYVLHNGSHVLGPQILRLLTGKDAFDQPMPQIAYYIALSIGMAAVSWHLLEKPFNRIRTRT